MLNQHGLREGQVVLEYLVCMKNDRILVQTDSKINFVFQNQAIKVENSNLTISVVTPPFQQILKISLNL